MEDKNLLYDLYLAGENRYEKVHSDLSEKELFPYDWNLIQDYLLKNKILEEALLEKKLIRDTNIYKEYSKR